MAAGVYEDIYKFLQRGQYPPELNKNEKRNFRRKANNNYRVDRGLLFYHHKDSTEWKQVPRNCEEKERILESCHTLQKVGVQSNRAGQKGLVITDQLNANYKHLWSL